MKYAEHNRVEVHDFSIVDVTTENSLGGTVDLLSVGIFGESRWLTPAEAEELAGAIFGAAAIHRARAASKVTA